MAIDFEKLGAAGVNVDDALARLMGSRALYERLLVKFLDDGNMARLTEAAAADDAEEGFEAAHALKGVCGNLSMTRLYELVSRQCDLFRAGDRAGAFALVPEAKQCYDEVREVIANG